jgi:hypothetical protein
MAAPPEVRESIRKGVFKSERDRLSFSPSDLIKESPI